MNIKIAKRENNSKRSFVFVNADQSKHIPSNPFKTYIDCLKLEIKLREIVDGKNKKVLVIAFAETATGIGAIISNAFNGTFITTTRERIPNCAKTKGKILDNIDIIESHSHAPEQKLYIKPNLNFDRLEDIIIIDDEYTTGNTAMKLINELKKRVKADCKFIACSFLIAKAARENFAQNNVESIYLEEVENNSYLMKAINGQHIYPSEYKKDKPIVKNEDVIIYTEYTNSALFSENRQNLGYYSRGYTGAMKKTVEHIQYLMDLEATNKGIRDKMRKIRIIGTEEYNYIPYLVGLRLCEAGYDAKVQSITRSPILVSDVEDYPLNNRVKLKSFYDNNRTVYLYNTEEETDVTLIITDAEQTVEMRAIMQDIGGVVNSKLVMGIIVK